MSLSDRANKKTKKVYASISDICSRTELDRKTVVAALAHLRKSGLIIDTGEKVGRTSSIPVCIIPCGSSSKNGTAKQSQISHEAVPFSDTSSSVFPMKRSQKRDTNHIGTQRNPKGTGPPRTVHEIEKQIQRQTAEMEKFRYEHTDGSGKVWHSQAFLYEYLKMKRRKEELEQDALRIST